MLTLTNWMYTKGHAQGIFWTICSCFFGNLCDTAVKLVSHDVPTIQITFCRLFFGTLLLLPFMLYWGKKSFYVKNISFHVLRIIVGFGAIACWIYGASRTSLPSITTISFACPLFVLPLAYICLGEKSDWHRMLSVVLGFGGVLIIACNESTVTCRQGIFAMHWGVISLLCAAVLFALSDILNKKMVATENIYALLFYFYLGTALISFIPTFIVWQKLHAVDILYLFMLGGGGIAILYCILQAAHATAISSVAPYKYIELVISVIVSYLIFGEIIKFSTFLGACLIIPGALYNAYCEINLHKKRVED